MGRLTAGPPAAGATVAGCGEPLYRMNPAAAVIGTSGGCTMFRLLTGRSASVARLRSLAALELVAHFSEPGTEASWTQRWEPEARPSAARVFESARSRGLVIPADSPPAGGPTALIGADDVAGALVAEVARLRAQLQTVDGATLPALLGEDRVLAPALVLQVCHHLLRGMTEELGEALKRRVRSRVGELAAAGTAPFRLHLGCGTHRLSGWVNIDLAGPAADLRIDVRAGLPFDDAAVEVVYIAHLLEHLEYPDDALGLLRECRRVLVPGGLLRVVVPDIKSFVQAYDDGRAGFFACFERRWERAPSETHLASFLHYAGAGEFPTVADRHRFGYDEATLGRLLGAAGFTAVRRCAPRDSRIGDPQLDYSWANDATAEGLPFSLIMEAEGF